MTAAVLRDWLAAQIAGLLGVDAAEIDPRSPFASHGLSSREAVGLSGDLERLLGRPLSPALLYDHPTPESLARYLSGEQEGSGEEAPAAAARPDAAEPVAIVGLACRFPGAGDPAAFWQLLRDGAEAVGEVPAGRQAAGRGGFLDAVDGFDPAFFGISPREAARMDPQQRLLLEVSWEALEDAAIDPATLAGGDAGVFVGISSGDWALLQLRDPAAADAWSGTGNAHSIAANRLSYLLDLRGPSLAVDTACSSSLVAVHLACQSLRRGECGLALAAGVNLILTPHWTVAFTRAGMLAADGRCKTFDAAADGYGRGEGCGTVVLKRLTDARRDGDRILGVIRGSAVLQDGRTNGLTAPNGAAQAEVVRRALRDAGVAPARLAYVEAHGTGTLLGDRIELESLAAAVGVERAPDRPCLLGSVKTNIGHLEAAAGIAGLIKTVLALRHGTVPPHPSLREPNPGLAGAPLRIPVTPEPWPAGEERLAGVSSFGFGGTLAHAVVEGVEETVPEAPLPARPRHLLTLSAQSPAALRALAGRTAGCLGREDLADVCRTANTGRARFAHRLAVAGATAAEIREALEAFAEGREAPGAAAGQAGPEAAGPEAAPVVFLYPGQGCQAPGMGKGLYESEPVFRAALDRCAAAFDPWLERPLTEVLFPRDAAAAARLDATLYTQAALFSLEVALTELWRSWGVVPAAVLGHSLGEYTAAWAAGALALEDALRLVAERARRMQALPAGGRMAAVLGGALEVEEAILPAERERVAVAALNGPRNTVVSGAAEAVEAVLRRLAARGIESRPLAASHAFHSPLVEPMLDGFAAAAARVPAGSPRLPLVSNRTGELVPPGTLLDADHWRAHTRQPVRFATGVEALAARGFRLFLELGPKPVLTALGRRALPGAAAVWLPSLHTGADDVRVLLDSLAALSVHGAAVGWTGFHAGRPGRRIALPTYPFQRVRCWIDAPAGGEERTMTVADPVAVPEILAPAPAPRRERIAASLRSLVARLLESRPDDVGLSTPFLHLGADSIVLLNALRAIESTWQVQLSVGQLFEELSTIDRLATHLDRVLPPDAAPEAPSAPPAVAPPSAAPEGIERILEKQLQMVTEVISRQLEALGRPPAAISVVPAEKKEVTRPEETPAAAGALPAFVTYRPDTAAAPSRLTPRQQRHVDELAARVTARTRRSRELARTGRAAHADFRNSMHFRLATKELLYPLVAESSAGSRIRDVDGNEYVDLTMGFGVFLFGHGPAFVTEAVQEQLRRGLHIGPQSDLAHEVAALLCEMTGMERAAFCNTGSEAVMTALRLARTATGRNRIALFSGSYHGTADGVLAGAQAADGGGLRSVPSSLGVPPGAVEDITVLTWTSPQALDWLRAHAHTLAAVLVEPVQSRHPDTQPAGFLRELRKITREAGAALIFDEVITGFRIHPGGAQAWFGVKADLAAYGKILGGGLPIGAVAGQARFLDCIDGGAWEYGDLSYPRSRTALFAGTFCKHPLAMAAARAVLRHLRREGLPLYQRLNRLTAEMVEELNRIFEERRAPVQVERFGSLCRFTFPFQLAVPEEADVFFHHLAERGVYVWEGRNCFLSTAHTEEDTAQVARAAREAVDAMREGGFFAGSAGAPVPAPAGGEIRFPLTPAQQQLWVVAQLGQAGFEPVVVRLSGLLRLPQLVRAFQRVVDRHEALRTVFDRAGELQRVLPELRVDVPLINFGHLPAGERDAQVAAWLRGEGNRPFDLSEAPLVRLRVLRLGEEKSLLVLIAHHIVVDGWSALVLLREVAAFYTAELTGAAAELPEPLQFRQAAERIAARREGAEGAAGEAFWQERLAGPPPAPDLPLDRPRPAVRSFRGDRRSVLVPAGTARALRSLAASRSCTPFMVLLAGFTALLHRLGGQDDLLTGFPVAGRSFPGGETVLGNCSHLVAFRSRLAAEASFERHLAATRSELLAVYAHQDAPAAGQPPLPPLGITFNLEPAAAPPPMAGLTLDFAPAEIAYTGGDLHLNGTELRDGLLVHVDFATDLFDGPTAQRLLGHCETLLRAAAEAPHTGVLSLPLLSAGERHQLLAGWNDTPALSADGFLERFGEQARRAPDAPAVACGGREVSYREIAGRAGRLAHHLRRLGAGPEVRVALCLEPSIDLAVSLLGVLLSGAAYVPLDPAHPADRLASLVRDAGALLVITDRDLAGRLGAAPARLVLLDAEREALEREIPVASTEVDGRNLAYVLYTSGSTGAPKGVAVEHRQLAAYVEAVLERLEPAPGSRFGLISTFTADLGHTMVFPALATGGCLDILTGRATDPAGLCEAVRERPLDLLKIVPSHLAALLAAPGAADLLPRRALVLGGEATPWELAERVAALAPGCRIFNHYGPTETTVGVAAGLADPAAPRHGATLPLGRPLAGRRLYLLGPGQEPVPAGVPGELYAGGAGVARGYLGRPEATAERFLPDPFAPEPGARLYRTGDLVRALPDGRLEFLGRADDQVKIRGYRVEPGEAAAQLARHPAVAQAAVVAREDEPGRRRLVAYVVAAPGREAAAPELRAFLEERLPEPLLPAAFVTLEALPLTPNGKLDRRALPAPEAGPAIDHPSDNLSDRSDRSDPSDHPSPTPFTPEEEILAGIWADLLGVSNVGRDDNFLELGGDSILGIQMVARALEAGLEVQIEDFFGYRTLGEFAAVTRLRRDAPAADSPSETPAEDLYPLSSMQRAMLLHCVATSGAAEYLEQRILTLAEPVDVPALERAWRRAVERNPILRTAFFHDGLAEPLQGVAPRAELSFETRDWSALPPEEQARLRAEHLAEERQSRGFDLSRPPLLRLLLTRLAADRWELLWSYHLLLLDGWSSTLLLREVRALYESACGRGAEPEPLVPYRAYIEWLQRLDLTTAEAFWRRELEGFTAPTPLGELISVTEAGTCGQIRVPLPGDLPAALTAVARRHRLTPNTAVQGALALLLGLAAGSDDVVFGSVVSGRQIDLPGAARIAGPLINTLPVRVRIAPDAGIAAWLGALQERQVATRRHEPSPLEMVQRCSAVPEGSRLFETILVFINHPLAGDGTWISRNVSSHQTGYPLHLVFDPSEDRSLVVTWRESHLDEATARRTAGHLLTLLADMARGLDRPVAGLSVLGETERLQLLVEWNDTRRPFPLDEPFPRHFRRQAAATPGAVAVRAGETAWTYGELAERADCLAAALVAAGLPPGGLVAVLAERGPWLLTALLGILAAGGVYLPLDPRHPAARHAQVLGHARVRLVLAGRALTAAGAEAVAALPAGERPPVEILEDLPGRAAAGDPDADRAAPGDLAYVIYTSGSTGAPKGAQVEHRGMLNHLFAKVEDLRLTGRDAVAQTAPQCFDISVWQLLAPLLTGGRVEIYPDAVAHDPRALLERVDRDGVTVLELVPSLLRAVLDDVELARVRPALQGLRWLMATGEALPPELCRRWLGLYPRIPVVNAYGPTECSDDVTHHIVDRPPAPGAVRTPIGRPVANTRLYVVDARMRLLPAGVAGELCVGGAGVGRGYLHDPERTAEVFGRDPFVDDPGARLYRTGDRALWRPDGVLEYLGRLDDQIKIRGVRIEPAEIEAALEDHPCVRAAAVVARAPEGRPGDLRLVAWVVPDGRPRPDDLAYHLGRKLPEAMVPSRFVLLDALPLTANGKIDRQALPDPGPEEAPPPTAAALPPRTDVEKDLAEIWQRALRLDRLGVQDNFFKLGGHSLLATQVLLRVRDHFGVPELPIHSLFETPTIARLAERIETVRWARGAGANGSSRPAGHEEGEL